jgi:hypothetical protein
MHCNPRFSKDKGKFFVRVVFGIVRPWGVVIALRLTVLRSNQGCKPFQFRKGKENNLEQEISTPQRLLPLTVSIFPINPGSSLM